MACSKAGIPTKLSFDPDDPIEGKIDGSLGASDLLALLWVCWIMGRSLKVSNGGEIGKGVVVLPDVSHLVISALVACGEIEDDEGIWDFDVAGSEKCVTAQKFCMWVLSTAPNLVHCFSQYVQERVRACASEEVSWEFDLMYDLSEQPLYACLWNSLLLGNCLDVSDTINFDVVWELKSCVFLMNKIC